MSSVQEVGLNPQEEVAETRRKILQWRDLGILTSCGKIRSQLQQNSSVVMCGDGRITEDVGRFHVHRQIGRTMIQTHRLFGGVSALAPDSTVNPVPKITEPLLDLVAFGCRKQDIEILCAYDHHPCLMFLENGIDRWSAQAGELFIDGLAALQKAVRHLPTVVMPFIQFQFEFSPPNETYAFHPEVWIQAVREHKIK